MLATTQVQTPKAPETVAEKALRLALVTYDNLKYRDRSQFNNAEKLAYETLLDLKVFMKGNLEDESHTAGYYHLNLVIVSTEVLRFWLDNNPKSLPAEKGGDPIQDLHLSFFKGTLPESEGVECSNFTKALLHQLQDSFVILEPVKSTLQR